MIAFIISPIGRYLAGAAVIIAALVGAYFYIKGVGYDQCKAEWAIAEQAAIERGLDARRAAERDVDSGSVSDDKHNRDRGPM